MLWKTLEQWQQQAGLGNSPRTLLEELGRLHSVDVVLPTAEARKSTAVFGSVARDEAGPKSDVDLLVEFERPIGLRFFDLIDRLQEILGC